MKFIKACARSGNPSRGLLVNFAEYCECIGSRGVRMLSLRKDKNTNDNIGSGIRLKGLSCALKIDTIDVDSENVKRSGAKLGIDEENRQTS